MTSTNNGLNSLASNYAHGKFSDIIQSYMDDNDIDLPKFQKAFNKRIGFKGNPKKTLETYVRQLKVDHYKGDEDKFVEDLFKFEKSTRGKRIYENIEKRS